MPPRCATISTASRTSGGRRAEAHGLVGVAFAALFFCPAVISCETCNIFVLIPARCRRCRVPAGCGIARLRAFPVSGFSGAAVPFGRRQKAARGLAEFCIVLSAGYSSTCRRVLECFPQSTLAASSWCCRVSGKAGRPVALIRPSIIRPREAKAGTAARRGAKGIRAVPDVRNILFLFRILIAPKTEKPYLCLNEVEQRIQKH